MSHEGYQQIPLHIQEQSQNAEYKPIIYGMTPDTVFADKTGLILTDKGSKIQRSVLEMLYKIKGNPQVDRKTPAMIEAKTAMFEMARLKWPREKEMYPTTHGVPRERKPTELYQQLPLPMGRERLESVVGVDKAA